MILGPGLREVERNRKRLRRSAELRGERIQPITPARDEDEGAALRGEGAREGLAYSARRAGDERPGRGQAPGEGGDAIGAETAGAPGGRAPGGRATRRAFTVCGERQLSSNATRCTQLTVQ